MKRFKLKFAPKFYAGIALVILSLIIGGITKLTFLVYFSYEIIRWASIILYFLSWPMLALGVWWVGKEYYVAIQKYFSYKYYHESVKARAKGAHHKTRDIHGKVKNIHHKVRKNLKTNIKNKLRKKKQKKVIRKR